MTRPGPLRRIATAHATGRLLGLLLAAGAPLLAQEPRVDGLKAREARAGDLVTALGANLDRVTSVRLGADRAVSLFFSAGGGCVLTFKVPDAWRLAKPESCELFLGFTVEGKEGAAVREIASGARITLLPSAPPPAPVVTGWSTHWACAGEQVVLRGRHLDQVDRILFGNRTILRRQADPLEPGGDTLSFTLPGMPDGRDLRAPVMAQFTLESAAWQSQPRRRVRPSAPFTCLPRTPAADPVGPQAPRFNAAYLHRPKAGDSGEAIFYLNGWGLANVLDVQFETTPCERFWMEKETLVARFPDGAPEPRWVVLTCKAGTFGAPVARKINLYFREGLAKPGSPVGQFSLEDKAESKSVGAAGVEAKAESKGEDRAASTASASLADAGKPAATVRLAGLYLTQAVQTLDGKVPLVQGRKACLRIFGVADQEGAPQPCVKVTIRDHQGEVRMRRVVLPGTAGMPQVLDQSGMAGDWNLLLPGSMIQPGMKVEAKLVLPGDAGPQAGAELALAPEVVPVPPVRITLVPIRLGGMVGRVMDEGRTSESWLQTFAKLFPVHTVTLRVAEEWVVDPGDFARTENAQEFMAALVGHLEARRSLAGGGDRDYWYGVLPVLDGSSHGQAERHPTARSAIGVDFRDDAREYHETFAHEMGHAFGLHHAPAGGATGPDPLYPHEEGLLDAWGYDLEAQTPLAPGDRTDIMGYGKNTWISAYHWTRVLRNLTRETFSGLGEWKAAR